MTLLDGNWQYLRKPPYQWIGGTRRDSGLLNDLRARGKDIRHDIEAGGSGSGKTHRSNFIVEEGVDEGNIKGIYLNLMDRNHLEEFLSFMFLNEDGYKKHRKKFEWSGSKPHSYPIKVFVPVSDEAPDNLPENFIPFTIPVNKLGAKTLKVLYGTNFISQVQMMYERDKRKIGKNGGLADLKYYLCRHRFTQTHTIEGFQKTRVLTYDTPSSEKQKARELVDKLRSFSEQGIFASENNSNNLLNLLRKDLQDQKTITAFYFGFLGKKDDYITEKYVALIFIYETIKYLMETEQFKRKLPYKVKLVIDEASFITPSQTSRLFSDVHYGTLEMMRELLQEGRHSHIEATIITQSMKYIESGTYTNVGTIYAGASESEADQEIIAKKLGLTGDSTQKIIRHWVKLKEKYGIYRFAELVKNDLKGWKTTRTKEIQVGFELPRPRLSGYNESIDGKVPLIDGEKDLVKLSKGTQREVKISQEMRKAKQTLKNEIQEREDIYYNKIKVKEDQEKKEQEQEKQIEETEENKILELFKQKTSIYGMAKTLRISREKIERHLRDTIEKEKLSQEEYDQIKQEIKNKKKKPKTH